MKKFIAIGLILIGFQSFSNVNFIQFDKIENSQNHLTNINFLKENVGYFNHWTAEWNYDISKKKLIKELKNCYDIFSKLDKQNLEVSLLLGDISHYLYNLSEEDYFKIAESHYKKAIEIAPNEFRPFWFIANHYALSAVSDKAIENYSIAQKLLPPNEPAEFWEEFTFATMTSNMISHSIYGMKRAEQILGKPSYIEESLGETIKKRLIEVDRNKDYDFRDIWTAGGEEMISFISRPLGLKFVIDSTWQVSFYNYQKNLTYVTMVPPTIANKNGLPITFTIAIIIKTANQGEDLKSFMDQFTGIYNKSKEIEFSQKYEKMISMDFENDTMYAEIGGAHMNLIGIEREYPEFPGMLLEAPTEIPTSEGGKVQYFAAPDSKNRFRGTIFYAIMLDTCEDIYKDSYKLFKELFENQLVIE